MKIAFIDKNPNASSAQFGVHKDSKFFNNTNQYLLYDVADFNPDVVFINKGNKFRSEDLMSLMQDRFSVYFYGDYRGTEIPYYAKKLAEIANLFLPTWYNEKIFKNLNQKNIRVVHQGTDVNTFRPLPDIEKKYTVAFVANYFDEETRYRMSEGEFGYRKDLSEVLPESELRLEVAIKLVEKYGKEFVIAGTGWEKYLQNKCTLLGKTNHEETNLVYNQSLCSIGISHYLNVDYMTSNRLFQAMASGTPHIAWHSPKVDELFDDSYLETDSVVQLLSLVGHFVKYPIEALSYGVSQRNCILERHTLEKAWDRILKIIELYYGK
jgi:hypothetical protein